MLLFVYIADESFQWTKLVSKEQKECRKKLTSRSSKPGREVIRLALTFAVDALQNCLNITRGVGKKGTAHKRVTDKQED